MAYYRVIEINPYNWDDTLTILERGGVHYGTLLLVSGACRKFLMRLTEDEVIVLKLKLSPGVEITLLDGFDYSYLKSKGFLK